MQAVVELEGVKKQYPGFELGPISLSLPQGYVMALIGPNGAGKSTLIKLILNLVRRDSGAIRLFGCDNIGDERLVKHRIGFVHEVPQFYAHLTVAGLGRMLAPFYAKWDRRRFETLADSFDLPLDRKFSKLSRGMKMKTALALALCHDAQLLILDEPTSGLDPVFRQSLLDRLRELMQDENRTILFSSQITSDVEKIADFVTYLRRGRTVFSSPLDEIRDNWAVVKGGVELLDSATRQWLRGYVAHAYGFQGLTDDVEEARRRFRERAVVERVSLEDILFLMEGRQTWDSSADGNDGEAERDSLLSNRQDPDHFGRVDSRRDPQ